MCDLQVLEAAISNASPTVGNVSSESIPIVIPNILPKLIKVNSNGANPIVQLLPGKGMEKNNTTAISFKRNL